MSVVTKTEISAYPIVARGKVRDVYAVADDALLIVTTDRISAFDVVLPTPIPGKGMVLNLITLFWMDMFADLTANHILARDVADFPAALKPHAAELAHRSVIVRRTKPLAIECIVRGYITGSGWKDYLKTGQVCGYALPKGLKESEKLEKPLFTPSTKAELGRHDENISLETACTLVDPQVLAEVERLSLAIYAKGRDFAADKGIIIADTKFEFGLTPGGKLLLIDEVLTPDSSRFWPADGYAPGRGQPSFDKQFVRDWLESVKFNKQPPAPELPAEIVARTREKYAAIYTRLTGQALPED
jgi:phosphoribosylaminoimidazole-succinocarboxamide synthase